MECNNCGAKDAFKWRVAFSKEGRFESCDRCSRDVFNTGVPDVYWDGPGYHPSLVDEKNQPIFLWSRRHKAEIMKQQNAREAGDMYRGSRGTELETVNKVNAERKQADRTNFLREAQRIRQGLMRPK